MIEPGEDVEAEIMRVLAHPLEEAVTAPGLPDRLAAACARVLPVDGACFSVTFAADRRLPIGAADRLSALAERLEFATGEGPCFDAQHGGRPVSASAEVLARRWPVYWSGLVAGTPYRSAVAVPVGPPLSGVAVLGFFLESGEDPPRAVVAAAAAAGFAVGGILARDLSGGDDLVLGVPTWLDTPGTRRRQQVWQAIGYLNGQRGVRSDESLALLRSHAFHLSVDLESAAASVLGGELPSM